MTQTDKIPEFNSPSNLSQSEVAFLRDNSEKMNTTLKEKISSNQDLIFKIEKEIGAFLNRTSSVFESRRIIGYYTNFVKNLGIEPKSPADLQRISKYPRNFKEYCPDAQVNQRVNEIIFKWGTNSNGEWLGDKNALLNIQDWYDTSNNKNHLSIVQNSLGIAVTGKVDENTLVEIVKFQIASKCKYVDGLIGSTGESMTALKKSGKYNSNLSQDPAKPKDQQHTSVHEEPSETTKPQSTPSTSNEIKAPGKQETKVEPTDVQQPESSVQTGVDESSKDSKETVKDSKETVKDPVEENVERILEEFGKTQSGWKDGKKEFKSIGNQGALNLLHQKVEGSIGEEEIFKIQYALHCEPTGKYDLQTLKTVVKFQMNVLNMGKPDGLTLLKSKTFDEIKKLPTYTKGPIDTNVLKLHSFKKQLDKVNLQDKSVDQVVAKLLKSPGLQYFDKWYKANLQHKDNPTGIKQLQALLHIEPNGQIDESFLKSVIKAQFERKSIIKRGNLDGKIGDDGETMMYLKEKEGMFLKDCLLDGLKGEKLENMTKSINEKVGNKNIKSEQVLNILKRLPSELLIDMILNHGSIRWEGFDLYKQGTKVYNEQINKILEDNIIVMITNSGIDRKDISSSRFERNPSTGTTLCAKTARLNLLNTFGVDADPDLVGASAQSIKKDLEKKGVLTNHYGLESAEKQMHRLASEFHGNVFDVFFDKYKDANGKDRKLSSSNEKYGHRVVAFIGTDGKIRVLDPYVEPKGGWKGSRQDPYLFKDHIFADKFSIGVSKNAYYSDKYNHYKF